MKVYGQLEKAQLENLASDPALAAEGMVYFNTTSNTPRIYRGGSWSDLSGSGAVSVASVITANSTTPALRITQTGTGDALLVEDSANPDSTPFRVDQFGNVSVGGGITVGTSSGSQGQIPNYFYGTATFTATANNSIVGISGGQAVDYQSLISFRDASTGSAEISYIGGAGGDDPIAGYNVDEMKISAEGQIRLAPTTGVVLEAPSVITANSTTPALRITQTGTGDALVVEDSANPDNTPFRVSATGTLIVGGDVVTSGSTLALNSVGSSSSIAFQNNAVISHSSGYGFELAATNFKFYDGDISSDEILNLNRQGSTFSTPTTISTNSTAPALRITQTGTGDALRVEDSANPDATPFRVDASGNASFLGGAVSIQASGTLEPQLILENPSGNTVRLFTTQYLTTLETYDEFRILGWETGAVMLKLDGYGARVQSGLATAIDRVSGSFTLDASIRSTVGLTSTSGTQTATLQDATFVSVKGRTFTIKRLANGASSYTVAAQSGQTIDGAPTYALTALNSFVTVQSDGANWWIIAKG